MIATPKEIAVTWLLDGIFVVAPDADREAVKELIKANYPEWNGKMTDAQWEKIDAAYGREVCRVRKMYQRYLASRGLDA
jgi:diketogulonate reductase-like aldo/keto reductase